MIPSSSRKGTWPLRARRLAYDLVTGRFPRSRDREKCRRLLRGTAATAATLFVFLVLLDLTVARRSTSGTSQAISLGERSHQYQESVAASWEVLRHGATRLLDHLQAAGPWLLLALTLLWSVRRLHEARRASEQQMSYMLTEFTEEVGHGI